jgi:hypothetical protein
VVFCIHGRGSCACALFPTFLNDACVCAPCVVSMHADCIVLDLLEMKFWSLGELICVLKMLDSFNHLRTNFC